MLIGPLPNINFLSKPKNVIGCHGTEILNFLKNILKSQHLRSYKDDKAETFQKCS